MKHLMDPQPPEGYGYCNQIGSHSGIWVFRRWADDPSNTGVRVPSADMPQARPILENGLWYWQCED
ncbi:MAG TPA: hypothetical protein VN519_06330 [Bryobacteraceae bacterium]|nr:hypothetical protein [Bryobacteraceae bacterium]